MSNPSIAKMLEQLEQSLKAILDPSLFPGSRLIEAANYAVFGGGKRLRPLLVLCTSTAEKGSIENALIPASAIELIHTYSLIHDDLPCMDNDDVRRGRPSLHRSFSEAEAILTGNFLLTYAFELISHHEALSEAHRLEMIRIISKSVGIKGMIGGQELDLRFSSSDSLRSPSTIEDLSKLHFGKTGTFIQACAECGVVIGNLNRKKEILEIASLLGRLYQLLDDLKDKEDSAKGRPSALIFETADTVYEKVVEMYRHIKTLANPFQKTAFYDLLSFWNPLHLNS